MLQAVDARHRHAGRPGHEVRGHGRVRAVLKCGGRESTQQEVLRSSLHRARACALCASAGEGSEVRFGVGYRRWSGTPAEQTVRAWK